MMTIIIILINNNNNNNGDDNDNEQNSTYFANNMCGISKLLQILWKNGFIQWKSIRLGRQDHTLLQAYNKNGLKYNDWDNKHDT